MPYAADAPDRPDPVLAAARIGELTRLAPWMEQPGLTLDVALPTFWGEPSDMKTDN